MIQGWLQKLRDLPEVRWAAVLFAVSFLLYANTLGHGYTWDDDIVIVHNPRVQQGFAGIGELWKFRTREYFADFTGYRPVTMTTFAVGVGIFGRQPQAAHAINVLLFAVLVVVLFRTLRRLLPNYHVAFAFFVALLFAVHPIHVEAVANIKSRDEILALLFALLALGQFVRHYHSGEWWRLALSAVWLTLAALSKEGALTYLLVLPLSVLLLDGDWRRKAIAMAKFPVIVLVLVGAFFALTGAPPGTSSPVAPKGYLEDQVLGNCMGVESTAFTQGDWQRIGNSGYLFWKHIEKFAWPRNLVYFSGYNMYPLKEWTVDRLQLGGLFFLGLLISAATIVWWRRLRVISFGWWYFCATIVIYLHLPGFLLSDTIADRFLFMPSVGLCLIVVAGVHALLRVPLGAAVTQGRGRVALGIFVGLGLVFGGMAFLRNRVWKDNLTLFSHDLPLLENCARAHYYYASELVNQLPVSKHAAQDKQAIVQHYERAIAITPKSYYAFIRLAQFYQNERNYIAQAALMQRATKVYPEQADVWQLLGMAQYFTGDYAGAIRSLDQALALGSTLEEITEYKARALEKSGALPAAAELLLNAIDQHPDYLFFYDVLADVHFDMGDLEQGFGWVSKLIERDPENPAWWRKMIGRYQTIGDEANAAAWYQEAVRRGVAL